MLSDMGTAMLRAVKAFFIAEVSSFVCVLLYLAFSNHHDSDFSIELAFESIYIACIAGVLTFVASLVKSRRKRRSQRQ